MTTQALTYKKVGGYFEFYLDGSKVGTVSRIVGINNRPTRSWTYDLTDIHIGKFPRLGSAQKATNAMVSEMKRRKVI